MSYCKKRTFPALSISGFFYGKLPQIEKVAKSLNKPQLYPFGEDSPQLIASPIILAFLDSATVLAVEPMKFIYRGRIAVFSIKVLRDERICVVAEQRPDCSEEEVRRKIVLGTELTIFYLHDFFCYRSSSVILSQNVMSFTYKSIVWDPVRSLGPHGV